MHVGQFALLSKQYTSQLPSAPRGLSTSYTSESLTQCNAFASAHTFPRHEIRRASRVTGAQNQRVYGVCVAPIWVVFGLLLFPRSQKKNQLKKKQDQDGLKLAQIFQIG